MLNILIINLIKSEHECSVANTLMSEETWIGTTKKSDRFEALVFCKI